MGSTADSQPVGPKDHHEKDQPVVAQPAHRQRPPRQACRRAEALLLLEQGQDKEQDQGDAQHENVVFVQAQGQDAVVPEGGQLEVGEDLPEHGQPRHRPLAGRRARRCTPAPPCGRSASTGRAGHCGRYPGPGRPAGQRGRRDSPAESGQSGTCRRRCSATLPRATGRCPATRRTGRWIRLPGGRSGCPSPSGPGRSAFSWALPWTGDRTHSP